MTKPTVVPQDLPAAGLCVAGGKAWFRAHELDFSEFLSHGTPIEVMRATGCPLAERACVAAEIRLGIRNPEASNGEGE